MRPESRLLGLLADPYPGAAQKEAAQRLLSGKIDGRFFLKQARREGTLGLVYYNSRNFDLLPLFSGEVREEAQQAYYRYAARNTFLEHKIAPLCALFAAEAIPLMILKGIALCRGIYPNPALRPVTDVDILVRGEDKAAADALLRAAGYRFVFESSRQLRVRHRAANSAFYQDADGAFSVHLHWHLVNNSWPVEHIVDNVSMEDVWLQARPVALEGAQVLTLGPYHELLFLILHAFLHGAEHLIWLSDIAAAAHRHGPLLDKGLLRRQAEAWGLSFIAPEVLSLTGRLLGRDCSTLLDDNGGASRGLPLRALARFLRKNTRSCFLNYMILFFLLPGSRQKLRFFFKTLDRRAFTRQAVLSDAS